MPDRSLQDVRRKFVELMRADPHPLPQPFDRWVAARFSPEEIDVIVRLERQYGQQALDEWVAEITFEARRGTQFTH